MVVVGTRTKLLARNKALKLAFKYHMACMACEEGWKGRREGGKVIRQIPVSMGENWSRKLDRGLVTLVRFLFIIYSINSKSPSSTPGNPISYKKESYSLYDDQRIYYRFLPCLSMVEWF